MIKDKVRCCEILVTKGSIVVDHKSLPCQRELANKPYGLKNCDFGTDVPVGLSACTVWCAVSVGKQQILLFLNDGNKDYDSRCHSANGEINGMILYKVWVYEVYYNDQWSSKIYCCFNELLIIRDYS
jgi:hypothetical protein